MFPQIFGKYVLEREIAAGGMARVYLATLRGAVGFEKRLVVKQIRTELASDEAFVTRFVEEAKTGARSEITFMTSACGSFSAAMPHTADRHLSSRRPR